MSSTTTPTRPRRTVRELIDAGDPEFLAGCGRIAASVRESLEAVAHLEPGEAALEGVDPAAIRAALQRAYAAPAVVRQEPVWPQPDPTEIKRFLTLLGKPKGSSRLRAFFPKGHARKDGDKGRKGSGDLQQIQRWQAEERGVYIVVANGGDCEAEITGSTAFFIEYDDRPKDWQVGCWRELGLPEPTMQIDTAGRSVHSYWVLTSPMDPQAWKAVQGRLLEYAKADPSIKDIPRVMRLPGTWHMNAAGKPDGMARIISASGRRYSPDAIEACLPTQPEPAASTAATATTASRPAHDARPLEQVREALLQIPSILPDTGQRDRFRSLAWGLLCTVREAGGDEGLTLALLAEHSPLVRDAAEYLKTEPHSITAGTFWHMAREAGWRPARHQGQQKKQQLLVAAAPAAPQTAASAPDGGGGGPRGLPWLLDRLDNGMGPAGARKTTAGDMAQTLLHVAGDRLRFNEMRLLPEIDGEPIEGHKLDTLHVELQLRGMNIAAEAAVDGLATAALQRPFHPVREYLDRVAADPAIEPLDLTALVKEFLRPGDPPGSLQARMLAKTLIGAVARAYQPGCKVDTACVLVGEQGAQKSTFWEALAGPDWYSSSSLGRLEKDALMLVHATWFLEIAEVETITGKRAAGELKNFLSTRVDWFRPPYGKTISRHQRPSVMVATSNRTDFLTDDTGSRRFWIIPVTAREIDVEGVRALRDRIWKTAVLAYRRGERWWLDKADEAASEIENQQFTASHPWEGPLGDWLGGRGNTPFTSAEALVRAGLRQRDQIQRRDEMALATVLVPMGWVQRRGRVAGERKRMWFRAEDAPVPTVPTCPNLEEGRLGRANASQGKRSGELSRPSQPKNEDLPEAVPLGSTGTQRREEAQKRSGRSGQDAEPLQRNGSAVPTSDVEVGTRLGQAPEVGTDTPSTIRSTTEWVEVGLAELRLAPHLMHLPELVRWLQAQPGAPAIAQAQVAGALDRLAAAERAAEQRDLLSPEVQP